jgi:hypothetical protein
METAGKIALSILGIIVIAALAVGAWQLGWFVKEKNVERSAHIYRQSYANQERLREDISEKITAVATIESEYKSLSWPEEKEEIQALESQARAITNITCHDAEQISGDELSPSQSEYISANCAP